MSYRKGSFFTTLRLIFHRSHLSKSSIKMFYKHNLLQIFLKLFVLCQLVLIFSTASLSQSMLDPGFGNGGKVFTNIGNPYGTGGRDAILQPDGKIIVVGEDVIDLNTLLPDFAVARFNQDGTIDTSFNNSGIVHTSFEGRDSITTVALQSDGKIVAVGDTTYGDPNYKIAVARYNQDGSLDTSFDADGKKTFRFISSDFKDYASDVLVQPDGKILIAGNNSNNFVLMRLNNDGSFDKSFAENGFLIIPLSNINFPRSKIALQNDGKIVLTGQINDSSFLLARYNQNGAPDSNFGNNGILTNAGGSSVAIQTDGKIVTAASETNRFLVRRYNPEGTIDISFGSEGLTGVAFGEVVRNRYYQRDIAIQPDGKIVITGSVGVTHTVGDIDFAVARLTSDGSIDYNFGFAGRIITNIHSYIHYQDNAQAVNVQPDGKIIVAGNSDNRFSIARYIPQKLYSTCRSVSDFNGDQRSDIAIFTAKGDWRFSDSLLFHWGSGTDRIVQADYDGDGKTDFGVYRNGNWYLLRSTLWYAEGRLGEANSMPVSGAFIR